VVVVDGTSATIKTPKKSDNEKATA
jgi:hypothetical protein